MDFYEAVSSRHTVREFEKGAGVDGEVLRRILGAGLKAPSNDHMREWEFVVLRTEEEKKPVLAYIRKLSRMLKSRPWPVDGSPEKDMYAYAVPLQYDMLEDAPVVILPLYKAHGGPLNPKALASLNCFASVWCVIENIFLAAAAEGLGCSMRIPTMKESQVVMEAVKASEGWFFPCYIGLGKPKSDVGLPRQNEPELDGVVHFGSF